MIPGTVSFARPQGNINRWVYEDFEAGDISHIAAVNSVLKRSTMHTYGRSAGALDVLVNKNAGAPSIAMEQRAGEVYDISCYIKMKETPLKDEVRFIFQAPSVSDPAKKAYNTVTVSNAGLRAGKWTHITGRYTCDGKGKLVGVADRVAVTENGTVDLRIGDGNISTTSANGKTIDYYLDDFTITPVNENSSDINISLDGEPVVGKTITASISGGEDAEGYIVSVLRSSRDGDAMVQSSETTEPEFSYKVTGSDKSTKLIMRVLAIGADGKTYGAAEAYTDEIKNESTAELRFETEAWTPETGILTGRVCIDPVVDDINVMSVLALYDADGRLVNISVRKTDLRHGESAEETVSVENVETAVRAKLMAIDSETLRPLCDAQENIRLGSGEFIYVDPENGNDKGSGDKDSPLLTINAAKAKASALVKDNDVYIMLKGGKYRLSSAVSFTSSVLSKNHKMVIMSYDGRAEFNGGKQVTGWTLFNSDKNIYSAYVGTSANFRQIYVNGVRGVRARSNVGLTDPRMTDTGYTCSDKWLAELTHPEDLELVYYVKWTNPRCMVDSITASGSGSALTMNAEGWSKIKNKGQSSVNSSYMPAWYENAYELIDEEGEWYFDKSEGCLYYKPRFFEDMNEVDVEIPAAEKLVTIRGTADNNASNLEFRNVSFKYSNWTKPTDNRYLADTQNNHQNGVTGALPEAAVELSYVDGITFSRCEFSKLGITAMKLTEGVKNCVIDGNEFYDISGSAISLGVPSGDYVKYINPNDERYVVRNNRITGNYIHSTGVDYMSAAAVSAAFPKDSIIAGNEIFDSPYSGMHLGYGWATYAETGTATENFNIYNNYIHNVMNNKVYDGGAIYTIGNTSGNGYNRIYGNYIKDVKNHYGAYYPDEGSQYWEFSSNVMDLSAYPLGYGTGGGSGSPIKWMHLWTDSIMNNRIVNNYSTTSQCRNDGMDNVVEQPVVCDSSSWPEAAMEIINAAGISESEARRFERGLQDVEALTQFSAKVGETFDLDVTAYTGKGERYDYRYADIYVQSSDPAVAKVGPDFRGEATGTGTAYVKVAIVEKGIAKTFTVKVLVEE